MGDYRSPAIGQLGGVERRLALTDRQLREEGRASGTQTAEALATLTALVNGLLAQSNVSVTGNVTAGGYVSATGNISTSGDFYTPHGRITPVVTSYVAAYIDSVGRIGATPSARRFKRDVHPHEYSLEQIMLAQVVTYRLRALVGKLGPDAPAEVGVIAEQLVHAGLGEFVVRDRDGRPFSVAYERLSLLALSGVQQLYTRLLDVESRLDAAGL